MAGSSSPSSSNWKGEVSGVLGEERKGKVTIR